MKYLADLLQGAYAKAVVEGVYTRLMDAASNCSQLSKKLIIAHRDWNRWAGDAECGGYYRARAVEASLVYYERMGEAYRARTISSFDFGDFPVSSALFFACGSCSTYVTLQQSSLPAHSLAHSVHVPRARSAQDRRAGVESVLKRWETL